MTTCAPSCQPPGLSAGGHRARFRDCRGRSPLRHLVLLALLAPAFALSAAEPALVIVAGGTPEIIAYRFDPASGSLAEAGRTAVGMPISGFAWSLDRRFLYACNARGNAGRVIALALEEATGRFVPRGEVGSGGKGPCHVALHPEGRWLFTANYDSGRLAVIPVRPDGALEQPSSIIAVGKKAHMVLPDRSGRLLVVACQGSDDLAVFRFDPASGKPTPATRVALPRDSGPRHLAWSADERHLYVINKRSSTITQVDCDLAKESFTVRGSVSTIPAGFTGENYCSQITLSADGKVAWAGNRGHDSIAIFKVRDATGELELETQVKPADSLQSPRSFALAPQGGFLLVAAEDSAAITVMRIDQQTGRLTPVGVTPTADKPMVIGFVPRP